MVDHNGSPKQPIQNPAAFAKAKGAAFVDDLSEIETAMSRLTTAFVGISELQFRREMTYEPGKCQTESHWITFQLLGVGKITGLSMDSWEGACDSALQDGIERLTVERLRKVIQEGHVEINRHKGQSS